MLHEHGIKLFILLHKTVLDKDMINMLTGLNHGQIYHRGLRLMNRSDFELQLPGVCFHFEETTD